MKINSYQNNNQWPYGDLTNKLTKQASTPQMQQAAESALGKMGITATDSMKKAYSIYTESGITPTAAQMNATNEFLNKAKGSESSKLETIAVTSLKGVDITEKNLSAVHSALNDTANESLTIEGLSPELKEKATPEALKSIKYKLDKLPPAVRQRLMQTLTTFGMSSSEAQKALAAMGEGSVDAYNALKQILPEQVFKGLEEGLQIESLKQLLDQSIVLGQGQVSKSDSGLVTLEELADELIQMKLPDEATIKAWLNQMSQDKMKAVLEAIMQRMADSEGEGDFGVEPTPVSEQEASGLSLNKKPMDTEEKALTTEEDPEAFFETLESWLDESLARLSSGYGSDSALTLLSSDLRRFIVTEVTVEMIRVKSEFDTHKKNSMDQLEKAQTAAPKEMAQIVSKVAEKLDHLIMHTDLSLYTDMKTERQLMGLSSELQKIASEATTQPDKALQDLKLISKKFEDMVFNPTKEKIVVKMNAKAEKAIDLHLSEGLNRKDNAESLMPRLNAGGSAKSVLDVLRHLGLNREPELMDEFFSVQKEFIGKSEEKKETFKELLMQLSQTEDSEDDRLIKAVEKGISHLTGQQLLNRPQSQQESQSLFFNIPLESQNQEMKLFVKARKSSSRMDWENCSLYVLIDLKAYGETGIRVNVSAKALSVTISNEDPSIMDTLRPIAQQMLDELKDVGYLPSEIKYSPFVRQKASEWIKPSQESAVSGVVKTDNGKGGFEWQV